MAVSVTTDLTDISAAESTADGGTWYRLNGTSNANPAQDQDAYIQGTGCVANKMGATTGTTDVGGHFNRTATFDLTNKHLFHWRQIVTAGNMLTKANRGIQIGLTNTSTTSTSAWSTTNFKKWFLDGSDTVKSAKGWDCYVVDPSGAADETAGTLTLSSVKNVGFLCRQNTSVTTTVSNQFVDAVRMGTGLTASASSGGDVITMADIYATDSTTSNQWGIVTQNAGVYYAAGKINIGLSGQSNACNFTDADQVLVWRNFPVSSTLYELNIVGNGTHATTVNLTGWVIRGQAAKSWRITCGTGGVFQAYGCALSNLGSATLSAASELNGSSISASGTIEANGATITACDFSGHTATQLKIDAASELDAVTNSTFTSPGTGHAVEITAVGDYTMNAITLTGYAGSNGSTGNEAVYVNVASGTVNIAITNGGSTPSIRTAGATVNVTNSKSKTFTGLPSGTEVRVRRGSKTLATDGNVTSGTYVYSYTPDDKPVTVQFTLPGYVFEDIVVTLNSSSQELPVTSAPDPSYSVS